MDTMTLLLLMMMMGGGGGGGMSGMMPLLLIMMLSGGKLNGGTNGATALKLLPDPGESPYSINMQRVITWALVPGLGMAAAALLGGVSGIMGSMMGRKNKRGGYRRRRTRVVYRNRYSRRR